MTLMLFLLVHDKESYFYYNEYSISNFGLEFAYFYFINPSVYVLRHKILEKKIDLFENFNFLPDFKQ